MGLKGNPMLNDTSKAVDTNEIEAALSGLITGELAPKRGEARRPRADLLEPEMPFGEMDQAVQHAHGYRVKLDHGRDALLTEFGKATLRDRYLMPGESYPGPVCPRRVLLRRRRGPCSAPVRLHLEALVHARDARPLQWRHTARPAHLLLPQ